MKVVDNRFNRVADHIVRPIQTSVMQACNIIDGVVVLHGIVHELRRIFLSTIILKTDFKRAYSKASKISSTKSHHEGVLSKMI